MMRDLTRALTQWLAAGVSEIGEIHIRTDAAGFTLTHRADITRAGLAPFVGPSSARHLANLTEAGEFRPLKTAPNLRRGWRLTVADVTELRRALDFFYPAMTGVWLDHQLGALTPVPLRATLERQSGMYRVTQRITDEQASRLIAGFCSGCLKRRLWTIHGADDSPVSPAPGELPLLCHEACNLLIAKAREVVKSDSPA